MTSPADTIREALSEIPDVFWPKLDAHEQKLVEDARAALTELEQQLADLKIGMIAAARTTEAAEADRDHFSRAADQMFAQKVDAEADRDRLADTLREARDWIADDLMPGNDWQARLLNRIDHALATPDTPPEGT